MKYYMIWYNEAPEEEQDDYAIIRACDLEDAKKQADKMFGEYVISVEPYNP